ncbi:MAG: hypothetical protein Q9219_002697 [cf. Caloplaca sp. 3 TL-2023]
MSAVSDTSTESSLPTSTSSLILPTASQNVSKAVTSLTRSTLSVANRLSSIHQDSIFVQQIADEYKLPLIANERCGSWYISPELKAGSAYFKSTDGHQGRWSFSTRRLNLHTLDTIGKNGGCVLIDSTRRGKSMPDALSKTVPIWCAVMNRLLMEDQSKSLGLCTPENVVAPSERSQIDARLDRFVDEAKHLKLDIPTLRQKISKPLRPIWITPDTPLPDLSSPLPFHPIICLTASRLLLDFQDPKTTYIQGAADDSEFWFPGLSPTFFWQHKDSLLSASENDLPRLVQSLRDIPNKPPYANKHAHPSSSTILIKPTKCIYITSTSTLYPLVPETNNWDAIIICAPTSPFSEPLTNDTATNKQGTPRILHLPCPKTGKLGSRYLRSRLHLVSPFVTSTLQNPPSPPQSQTTHPKILFACATGTDLSAGAALVALCLCIDEEGKLCESSPVRKEDMGIDKASVRQRLAWITQSKSDVNPSRETLKGVYSCLMGR